jgi:hypothetical protein
MIFKTIGLYIETHLQGPFKTFICLFLHLGIHVYTFIYILAFHGLLGHTVCNFSAPSVYTRSVRCRIVLCHRKSIV